MTTDTLKQRPFADLELPPPPQRLEKAQREKRHYQKKEPVYTKKLYDELSLSGDQIGKMIGCSGQTITQGILEKSISAPVETAAKGIYTEMAHKKNHNICVAMVITRDAYDLIQPWLDKAGARVTVIE
jgi:hypothetical protein